jgi:hypothetical protein
VPASQRLKALMKEGASVYSSPDGLSWNERFGVWSAKNVDPGFAVFRNPLNHSEVVVTARPQGMRRSGGGRHVGFNAGLGWKGLRVGGLPGEPPGGLLNQALPLDNLYDNDVQSYGLPSFAYGGMVVSFWWLLRDGNCSASMRLPPGMDVPSCGTVSAALAYSYNSRNWSAFGQTPESTSRWAKHGIEELFPNVPGRPDSMQTYPNTLLEVEGRLLVHASAATHMHGFVAPGGSSMVTYELRLDGFVFLSSNASDSADANLTTKMITWHGGDLLINADAKLSARSSVSVGVLDGTTGAAIPGYGLADAPAFRGNSTGVAWEWGGGRKMAALVGRELAIAVSLSGEARLFSIRGRFAPVKSDDENADLVQAEFSLGAYIANPEQNATLVVMRHVGAMRPWTALTVVLSLHDRANGMAPPGFVPRSLVIPHGQRIGRINILLRGWPSAEFTADILINSTEGDTQKLVRWLRVQSRPPQLPPGLTPSTLDLAAAMAWPDKHHHKAFEMLFVDDHSIAQSSEVPLRRRVHPGTPIRITNASFDFGSRFVHEHQSSNLVADGSDGLALNISVTWGGGDGAPGSLFTCRGVQGEQCLFYVCKCADAATGCDTDKWICHRSKPPPSVQREQTDAVNGNEYRFYDAAVDGEIPLAEVKLVFSGYHSTSWSKINITAMSTWATWTPHGKSVTLLLGKEPLTQNRVPRLGEPGSWRDTK